MSKNNFPLPFFASSRCLAVGGQAILEGVMIRNGEIFGLAIRNSQGQIYSSRYAWHSLGNARFFGLPFVRGFVILLEALINGIRALNISAGIAENTEPVPMRFWQMFLSLTLAILLAIVLFILAPHLLSMFMLWIGLGTDLDKFGFHLWDGFYKCVIFIAYIYFISFVPEICRLFQYHGAEHKVVHAWEEGFGADYREAHFMSRLHPRCGTTFILLVICVSIITQSIVMPLLLSAWTPQSIYLKHAWSIFIKLLLIVPVSCISYEIIRFSAQLKPGLTAFMLQAPGLALQRLTTREPNLAQLEVAAVALYQATDSVSTETGCLPFQ